MERTGIMEQLGTDMSLGKPKILMVDDRPENLVALDRLLRGMEVDLYKANSGNEALKLTLYHDFALALLDIQMPEMDGYELAEILRSEEKTARMPFIFVSAIYTDQIHVFRGYEKGAFSFITKPFEPVVLTSKIDFFVEKYQQEQMLVQAHKLLEQRVKELQAANQELKTFSYSVSHDLRAPLRSIEGFSKALLEAYEGKFDETADRWLNFIVENANRMGLLISDMLAFSKVTQSEISRSPVNMRQMAKDVFEEEKEQYADKTVHFQLDDIPEIIGDKAMIRQVWKNLLSNALKYSSKKEEINITISCHSQNGFHHYSVKDNGAGFDEKYKDQLFGVFQRLHGNDEFEGTGVGLAIVFRIVNKHGGQIDATGKLGEGSEFVISFPINND